MDSDRIPRVPPYSGYCCLAPHLRVRGCHTLWPNFPVRFHFVDAQMLQSYNPRTAVTDAGLGCSRFARHYSGNHCCFLFLRLLRCFSSAGLLSLRSDRPSPAGLPHSEIRGSNRVGRSPRLIAAYYVLLRLQEPRHPPYALIYFLTCLAAPFCCASKPSSHP